MGRQTKNQKKNKRDSDDDDENDQNDQKEELSSSSDSSYQINKSKQKKANKKTNKSFRKDQKTTQKNDDDDDDNDNEEVNSIDENDIENIDDTNSPVRHVKVNLNSDYDIPECYVDFFSEKNKKIEPIDKSKIKLKIEVKKYRQQKQTVVSFEKSTFTTEELKELKKYIEYNFHTSCCDRKIKEKNKKEIYFNVRKGKEIKQLLVKEYGFNEKNIKYVDIMRKIPEDFFVNISLDENNDNISIVEFNYKKWNDEMFREFIDEFKSTMETEWSMSVEDENDRHFKYSITLRGDNFNQIFMHYFFDELKLTEKQVKIQRALILSKKYSKINTYKEMKERFASFDSSSYLKEMEKTIRDTYSYEKKQLSKYVIHTDLIFDFVFTDDEGNNYYSIYIDVCNTFSIDGANLGHGISEGHEVVVRHKRTNATIIGYVTKIKNGIVSVIFRLKKNQIPPGSRSIPKGKDNSTDLNDYIYANFDEDPEYKKRYNYDDDDDDEYGMLNDDEEEEEPENDKCLFNGQYKITFQPNNAIYRRSAMALLILNDIESPIKDIIVNNSEASNKICNETITDDPIDIKNFRLTPTPSQKDCINNILQNHLSLIQGPPGCGKTTSIGFFVYHLLKRNGKDRKRILLCAYSNQAVENMVKVVSPIVKAMGKKMVWIPKQSMRFETEDDFQNATEEEQYLSYYKIMKDDKSDCPKFKKLQEKKWKFEAEYARFEEEQRLNGAKNFVWNSNVEYFSEYDKNLMNNLQLKIEEKLVSESDVVCCTLLQSAKRSVVDFKFEYLFVDEATQVDQVTSLIPLIHQPSRMILLGDHKQLDPFIPEELVKKHPSSTKSLYLYLISKNIKSVMLKTQFRMHPLISEFPNREFYDNQIIDADGIAAKTEFKLEGIKTPILFVDVKGVENKVFGTSYRNEAEANVVVKLLHNFQMNEISGLQVGVITPYFGQKDLLRKKAASLYYNDVRISSVDSFQGSERDYIILSLVRTNKQGNIGFLANPNRINVSITRARRGLIIVGDFDSIVNSNANGNNMRNQFLVNMCKFYKEKGAIVSASAIQKIPERVKPALKIEYRKKEKDIDDDDDYHKDDDDDIEYVSDNEN